MKTKAGNSIEKASRYEDLYVGALLRNPELCRQMDGLHSGHFLEGHPRTILATIEKIASDGNVPDLGSVIAECQSVPPDYVTRCYDLGEPKYLEQYRSKIWDESLVRSLRADAETLSSITDPNELIAKVQEMNKKAEGLGKSCDDDFSGFCHTSKELEEAKPVQFLINRFLQAYGINLIAALPKHFKTWFMLCIVRSLIEGTPLFDYEVFSVPEVSKRVLYLVPECSLGSIKDRLSYLNLTRFVGSSKSDRLLIHTLSKNCNRINLDDPTVLRAAEGADVFLDTAVRFMSGDENSAEDVREFSDQMFRMISSGARSVTVAHHSPKKFESQTEMSLQNVARGSGDLGANLSVGWGLRKLDADGRRLWVQCIADRDCEQIAPFILEGKPHLFTKGTFKMVAEPGTCGEMKDHLRKSKSGRPEAEGKADKMQKCAELRGEGKSVRAIAHELGITKSSADRLLFQYDHSSGNGALA